MIISLLVDILLFVTVVIILAYIVARIDIELIHRRALKQREQQRLIDTLRK